MSRRSSARGSSNPRRDVRTETRRVAVRTAAILAIEAIFGATFSAGSAAAAGTGSPAPLPGPVRIVVPFGGGGIADLTARAVGQGMEASLGTTVIIDNRPGAGGVVAGTQVAKSRPDGRTLLLVSNGTAVSASLFKSLPFDTLKSFAPVTTLGGFAIALVVADGSRLRTLADLIAEARARPGKLNIGTIAIGSTQHLSAELFKTRAAIDVQVVPFNGTPALITAVRAGHVDVGFEIVGPLISQVGAGALRVLAVSSVARSPAFPDVPTVAEAGVRDYDVVSWNGLSAPAGTPAATIDRLKVAVDAALAQPGVRQQLRQLGVEPLPGSPEALQRRLVDEIARWSAVIERAGIERQ